ncbi:MAG: DegV family EDD domain-containing protein [Candidatus Cloacimonetes bacterium]|nr:DegV family EDD domain-containing protein [Candidatus Cloacimonadota bacterium]
MKIRYLDGKRFYHGLIAGGEAVIRNRKYLNKINVFPVADADTGTNLALTMQAILSKSKIGKTLKETLHSVADSALAGARGNSGIIFAQFLHGLSHELPEKGIVTVKHFAESAQKSVKHLYDSLMNPVEGTMLTVIREWSDSLVEQSEGNTDFLFVLNNSLTAAKKSLKETPEKLKVLADAGVVDAGASGFVSFLEGVVEFIDKGSLKKAVAYKTPIDSIVDGELHLEKPGKYRYCSEAILSAKDRSMKEIREAVAKFGDSLILAGDPEKLHVHIHTNTPELLFEEFNRLGDVSGIKVDDMLRQYEISHNRKYDIGLITDTASDLPEELIDKYQIQQIPFGITFGNRQYLDKRTIQSEHFYHLLKNDRNHPVSSQPSPQLIRTNIEFSVGYYDKIIAVHISDKLSGVVQTATSIAKDIAGTEIKVINSRQLSVSEGLITLRFAEAIAEGMAYDDIIRESDKWIKNTKIYTDINTLKYMVRGGRVKPLTGFIAAVLNLKPIVSLDEEGKALAYGKSFSRKSNMKKITNIIKTELKKKGLWKYAIVHADAEKRANQYAEILTTITGQRPAYIMPLSPVVGVHNGIGTVGIGVIYD